VRGEFSFLVSVFVPLPRRWRWHEDRQHFAVGAARARERRGRALNSVIFSKVTAAPAASVPAGLALTSAASSRRPRSFHSPTKTKRNVRYLVCFSRHQTGGRTRALLQVANASASPPSAAATSSARSAAWPPPPGPPPPWATAAGAAAAAAAAAAASQLLRRPLNDTITQLNSNEGALPKITIAWKKQRQYCDKSNRQTTKMMYVKLWVNAHVTYSVKEPPFTILYAGTRRIATYFRAGAPRGS
jgi:hypothetical protein